MLFKTMDHKGILEVLELFQRTANFSGGSVDNAQTKLSMSVLSYVKWNQLYVEHA